MKENPEFSRAQSFKALTGLGRKFDEQLDIYLETSDGSNEVFKKNLLEEANGLLGLCEDFKNKFEKGDIAFSTRIIENVALRIISTLERENKI